MIIIKSLFTVDRQIDVFVFRTSQMQLRSTLWCNRKLLSSRAREGVSDRARKVSGISGRVWKVTGNVQETAMAVPVSHLFVSVGEIVPGIEPFERLPFL